jgi:peptidoglycan lytic transglycosylase
MQLHKKQYFSFVTLMRLGLMTGLGLLSLSTTANPSLLPIASILISEKKSDLLNSDLFIEQRKVYQQAEKALKARRYSAFKQLIRQLDDYPLLPYLQYKNLKRQLGGLDQSQIQNFLQLNDQSLIGEKFRRKLIRHYSQKQRWNDLIDVYQPQRSISLQCRYLDALIHTGKQEQAFEKASKLWLSASSLPKSCDSVFNKWQQAGHQTSSLTWQRIELTMDKGRTQLTRFLARSLSPTDRRWVNLWIKLRQRPHLAAKFKLLKSEHAMAPALRSYAIKRLSRKDPKKAITLLQQLSQSHSFSEQQTHLAYRAIGLSMARKHHPDAYIWLNKVASQYHDKYSREWLIRSAIRHENWIQTVASIEKLPTSEQAGLRWQFWWAYAQNQLGNHVDAEGIFHYLSARRSYYGFLAADHLGLPYAFENRPVEFSRMEMSSINHYPAALRARELYRLGKVLDARREWYSLTLSLSKRQKLAASKLAQQWQWHDRAIYTMGKTDYRDDIQLRFPLPMKEKVESWSARQNIEPALTYAIIRRESAFMADARSHMGALGLMQIQPRTARSVAKNMRVKYRGKHSLLNADTNLKLGTGYLNQMLKRLSSQYALATAAYNAGPHRVQGWLPDTQPMDAIRWIETIPFSETREYVSNVLAYTTIYQYLLHDQYTRLSSRMPPVPARNPAPKSGIMPDIALIKDH